MNAGEVLTNAALSTLIVWLWWAMSGFGLVAAGAMIQAFAIAVGRARQSLKPIPTAEEVAADPNGIGQTVRDSAPLAECYCPACRAARAGTLGTTQSLAAALDWSVRFGGRPRADAHELGRRQRLVERLALDIGEDQPVFCSWPAGHQEIRIPTRGGDPLVLRRTDECVLDDSTGRLAVVYRLKSA